MVAVWRKVTNAIVTGQGTHYTAGVFDFNTPAHISHFIKVKNKNEECLVNLSHVFGVCGRSLDFFYYDV